MEYFAPRRAKKGRGKACFVRLTENTSSFDGWQRCRRCCYQQPDKAVNNESKMISRFHRYAQRHFVGVAAAAAAAAVSICILLYISFLLKAIALRWFTLRVFLYRFFGISFRPLAIQMNYIFVYFR